MLRWSGDLSVIFTLKNDDFHKKIVHYLVFSYLIIELHYCFIGKIVTYLNLFIFSIVLDYQTNTKRWL